VDAHVLVPVKRLDEAKTRLSEVLSAAERAALAQELLAHVLTAVRDARVGPVTVVTSEQELDLDGIGRFDDDGLPWNDALTAAMRDVRQPVALVVAADLPLLTAADVCALVHAIPGRGMAIARARDGGTNAVGMRPPGLLATQFGEPQSAALHERATWAAGADAHVLDLPGLAFDVDTPADLSEWR
jgi:2-phospho-L-lactate guanylyltransferase